MPTVNGLLLLALVISAMLGPLAGRLIGRYGGRPVLMGCSGVFALRPVMVADQGLRGTDADNPY